MLPQKLDLGLGGGAKAATLLSVGHARQWRGRRGQEVPMLVVSRKEGEEVVIGDPRNPIGVVRVASVKGDRVRLAFEFPRDVPVYRRELADKKLAGEEPSAVVGVIRPANHASG